MSAANNRNNAKANTNILRVQKGQQNEIFRLDNTGLKVVKYFNCYTQMSPLMLSNLRLRNIYKKSTENTAGNR